jgi:hypothetical protein
MGIASPLWVQIIARGLAVNPLIEIEKTAFILIYLYE